ncbi:MAG: SHOCT domain-containing protein [Gammaproteobacteria bacterium]|nr:SHOCT domain-containing protein [Gammaproteobacteria bacterium]
MKISASTMLICLLWPPLVVAQASDAAAERARIADQRIQAEVNRRAEEEERRRQAEAQLAAERAAAEARSEKLKAQQVVREDPPVTTIRQEPPRPPAGSTADTSRALQQLRTLGELRDAGYVTEEEFARIKNRILESQF